MRERERERESLDNACIRKILTRGKEIALLPLLKKTIDLCMYIYVDFE